jgi:DNA-binding NarL/FixJ family response regulator
LIPINTASAFVAIGFLQPPTFGAGVMNLESLNMVRILLVEEHPVVRQAVREAIATQLDLSIAGEVATLEAALAVIERTEINLAIVDMSLGSEDGLTVVRKLRQVAPGLRVLMYSLYQESLFAEPAFKAGADGYLMKNEPPDRLIYAIREVLAGRKYSSPPLPPR